jgi:3-oxoacyl-[acyl-carrier-protein] synthase II
MAHAHGPCEPIAVVGIGCRFPQAEGAAAFWQLLVNGVDAIGPLPDDRWPDAAIYQAGPPAPGHAYAPRGGFVARGDWFDRELFGVSEHDAERMDPQQGMALELAWHALEDAGIAPSSVRGHEVGVYLGVSTRDFDRRSSAERDNVDVRTALGACGSVVANRISYLLGLCGPSMAIDVGCASSLASIHTACQALRLGECTTALAGGVQLILSPANIIAFSQGKLLAQDGRCKSFSSQADGYVCGEGGGLVVLKPLAAALRDGDRVYALVRGSAVNHNGASNGLSAPLGPAQRKLIATALRAAAVAPSQVGYVEAHSIGTLLGDAIEVNSLTAVLGEGRSAAAVCQVGSVKSNIGHLEAAAGVAAFIKATLAVYHGFIPRTLHVDELNPHLKLTGTPFQIATAAAAWPEGGARTAGVNAFSFGGANAHVVIGQAAAQAGADGAADGPCVLVLSAQSAPALDQLAAHYAVFLGGAPAASWHDICRAAATGRAHLRERLALVATSAAEAGAMLARLARGEAVAQYWRATPQAGRALALVWQGGDGAAGQHDQDLLRRLLECGVAPARIECSADQAGAYGALAPGLRIAPAAARTGPAHMVAQGPGARAMAAADLQSGIALAYVHGAAIAWQRLFGPGPHCALPPYPMQRARHWKLAGPAFASHMHNAH